MRSADSQSFRAIFKKVKELKSRICIESLRKSDSNVEAEVKQGGCPYKVTISNQLPCECSSLQLGNRRTCDHIVWLLQNISEADQLFPQAEIGGSVLEIMKVAEKGKSYRPII